MGVYAPETATFAHMQMRRKTMRIMLDARAYMPERAHADDAGLDLRSREDKVIPARGSATFDTGVHMELPPCTFGKIESKSGLNVKQSIVSCGGVIDEGYTGSIRVKLYNLSDYSYTFEPGDKIAQLVIQPYIVEDKFIIVDSLTATERGDAGFGSTGK